MRGEGGRGGGRDGGREGSCNDFNTKKGEET